MVIQIHRPGDGVPKAPKITFTNRVFVERLLIIVSR